MSCDYDTNWTVASFIVLPRYHRLPAPDTPYSRHSRLCSRVQTASHLKAGLFRNRILYHFKHPANCCNSLGTSSGGCVVVASSACSDSAARPGAAQSSSTRLTQLFYCSSANYNTME